MELAKTCQCIDKYLNQYKDFNDFKENHKFSNDFKANWKTFKLVSNQIYNVGTELVPDFFKEQKYIKGREYIVKPDTHVKRFFEILCNNGNSLTDKQVFNKLMEMYENCNEKNKREKMPPYNLDKLIFLIGSKLNNVQERTKFAEDVRNYAMKT